jgi:spore germination cell wall hydrolase CwlJ-like protein
MPRIADQKVNALGLGLAVAGLAGLAGAGWLFAEQAKPERATKPSTKATLISAVGPRADQPFLFLPLTPEEAYAYNASVPIAKLPNPAAAALNLTPADAVTKARAVDCLTAAVYYEAASESVDGQRAVAQVVLNRVRHPAYPKTVCGVVFQGSERVTGCQFTFTCDGALARKPGEASWRRAQQVAEAALAGSVYAPVGHATHYHTLWVAPYWSPSLVKVASIGAHVFYRWGGGWGLPGAFVGKHAGFEPVVGLSGVASEPEPVQLASLQDVVMVRLEEPAPLVASSAADVAASEPEIVAAAPAPENLKPAVPPAYFPKPVQPAGPIAAPSF